MKVLIWILSFFAITILNVLFGFVTGFRMGGVLLYLVWYFIARKLCDNWEKNRISNMSKENDMTSFEYIMNDISDKILSYCETVRGKEEELKSYLKQCSKEGQITRAQADIICEEYMWSQKIKYPTREKKADAEPDKICFCRKCGEKLIDSSKFCRKCGTEIVEEPAITIVESENIEFCKKCGADITNDTDTCHVCGEQKGID